MLYETLNPHGGEVYARKIDLDFSHVRVRVK